MNKILKIAVCGETMERSGDVAGAAGSHNAVTLALTFDKAWDGTTKTCYFFDANGENPVFRLLTADLLKDGSYWLPIPSEPLVHAGRMTLSVRGVETAGGVCSRVMMSASTLLRVLDTKVPEKDTAPADVTPTQAEQIQHQIDKMLADLTAQADRAAAGANVATEKARAAATAQKNAEAAKNAAAGSETGAAGSATTATEKAKAATDKATLAQSYAVGGTGSRANEDTDNALYYKNQAVKIVGGDFPTRQEAQGYADTAEANAKKASRPVNWTPSAAEVGAAAAKHGHTMAEVTIPDDAVPAVKFTLGVENGKLYMMEV